MTKDYVVDLHSVGEEVTYRGVAELKEVGNNIYVYGPEETLYAVLEKNDIKKLVPFQDNDI